MISKAVLKYTRMSPRKARLLLRLVKGRSVPYALGLLDSVNNSIAHSLSKLLKSACANAKRFPNVDEDALYISNIYADGGPLLKRYRAEAMGRASVLRKPTAHITVELDIKEDAVKADIQQNKKGARLPAGKKVRAVKVKRQAIRPRKKAKD
ncbi:MAG: 50S ribosomal protein L22 [Candidatus Omnitrophota bacterium]|jgi:large subunit ribosomal protein L22